MLVSSSAVLQRTGIANPKTLTRWHQAGIIPTPTIATHPNGRGKIAYYPEWVIAHILRVREFLRKGHTLEAAAVLASEAAVNDALQQQVLVDGVARPVAEVFLDHVIEILRPLVSDEAWLGAVRSRLVAIGVYRQAVIKVENGENPILVVTPSECGVAPDYGISAGLSEARWRPTARVPFVAVPLLLALERADVAIGVRRASDYSVQPVNRVLVRGSRFGDFERDIDHEIVPDSYWRGFTVGGPAAKPKATQGKKRGSVGRKRGRS